MTARQIIDQIKDLSPEDRSTVIDFIKALETAAPGDGIRYADDKAFATALDRVMEEDAELLKRLAE